ncbi:MAG: hypothetical protein ACK8QZ_00045 [Anaerolineales bacterium]
MNISIEWLSGLLGFLLTLAIFSYLIGDNPLFRLVVHLFVGASSGYIAALIFRQVWLNQLLLPLLNPQTDTLMRFWLLLSLLLAVLLLAKVSARLNTLGTPSAAILSGIAAALVMVGALQGTIFPQLPASAAPFASTNTPDTWVQGAIALVGTIGTLVYFHFGADRALRRGGWVRVLSWIGLLFLGLTFGALFASLYSSALTALIERIHALISFIFP